MKKAISLIIYIIYVAFGAWLYFSTKSDINSLPNSAGSAGEGIAIGLSEAILTIFSVFFTAFIIFAGVALLFKIIHAASGLNFFGVLCIIFDLVFIFVFGALLLSMIGGEEITAVAIGISVALLISSIVSLVANIASLSD